MESIVGNDGLLDSDRDEDAWLNSDKHCYGCDEVIKYGDNAVLLMLVYPVKVRGTTDLLEALEENGNYTVEPLFYEFDCWDGIKEELTTRLSEMFITPARRHAEPGPLHCSFCGASIGYGCYCAWAMYGSLDTRKSGTEKFVPSPAECADKAELMCMDCIEYLNEELDDVDIWTELWMPDDETEP